MDEFKASKIYFDSESVAEQLRSARQEKGWKLDVVAEQLNINIKYLKALERGNYNELPAKAYGRSFLREYSRYLGLNYERIIEAYEFETGLKRTTDENIFSKQKAKKSDFIAMPKIARNVLVVLGVSVCFLYLLFCLKKLSAVPELSIENPPENLVTEEQMLTIIGYSEPESRITINGEEILNDTTGKFYREINLKKGINSITIAAEKKFGRKQVIERQVLVKDADTNAKF